MGYLQSCEREAVILKQDAPAGKQTRIQAHENRIFRGISVTPARYGRAALFRKRIECVRP
jgi:hypothetical protein